jgi:hypothetical protein
MKKQFFAADANKPCPFRNTWTVRISAPFVVVILILGVQTTITFILRKNKGALMGERAPEKKHYRLKLFYNGFFLTDIKYQGYYFLAFNVYTRFIQTIDAVVIRF